MRCFNKNIKLNNFIRYLKKPFAAHQNVFSRVVDFSTEKWNHKGHPIFLKFIFYHSIRIDKTSYVWYPKRLRGKTAYELINEGYEEDSPALDYYFKDWQNRINLWENYYGKNRDS